MTKTHCLRIEAERKRGQHLDAEARGAIQQLKRLGYSNRAIAREIDCSPSTVGYELKRGTPAYVGRGRKPGYSAKRGAAVYRVNRSRCHRGKTVRRNSPFMKWMVEQIRVNKWSFDTCVGRAKLLGRFERCEIPCIKTLYNSLCKRKRPLLSFVLR